MSSIFQRRKSTRSKGSGVHLNNYLGSAPGHAKSQRQLPSPGKSTSATPLRKSRHDTALLNTIKSRTSNKTPNRPLTSSMHESMESADRFRRYVNVRTSGSRMNNLMQRTLGNKPSA